MRFLIIPLDVDYRGGAVTSSVTSSVGRLLLGKEPFGANLLESLPDVDHDDTIEAHYASLERGIPCGCYGGYYYIGHMVEGEDGDEVKVFEAVPCSRCNGLLPANKV